jgi:hypothetical protein
MSINCTTEYNLFILF